MFVNDRLEPIINHFTQCLERLSAAGGVLDEMVRIVGERQEERELQSPSQSIRGCCLCLGLVTRRD